MTSTTVNVSSDLAELSQRACDAFCTLADETIARQGVFRVALAGGSTPKALYQLLSKRQLDWSHIRLFLGDERNVPLDSDESNYKMVRETLIDPAGIDPSCCKPLPINVADPVGTAAAYEKSLKAEFGSDSFPAWDLVLLGMGDDAHTASLFPGTDAQKEGERWYVANWVPKFDSYRLTLTYPAINSAQRVWFLVAGAGKREALQQVRRGDRDVAQFPSQGVEPVGELVWWLDRSSHTESS